MAAEDAHAAETVSDVAEEGNEQFTAAEEDSDAENVEMRNYQNSVMTQELRVEHCLNRWVA